MSQSVDYGDLINLMTGGNIASLDALINLRTGGGAVAPETRYRHYDWVTAGVAAATPVIGTPHSLWTMDGIPAPGVVPTTWANPTNATDGGLGQADPGGGRTKRVASASASSSVAGQILIYDRLGHMGGLSGTNTGTQSFNGGSPAAITRNTGGARNIMFLEIYSALGATATTFTVNYTNQSGALVTSPANVIGGTANTEVNRMIPVALASGDSGVQSATSCILAASTLTAGNFGLTIARPLFSFAIGSTGGMGVSRSYLDASMRSIVAGACLAAIFIPITATAAILDFFYEFVEA